MGALKRRIGGALALAAGVATLEYGPASAQPNETVLPEIAVTNTRLVGGARGARRGVAPGSGADVGTEAPADSAGASGIVTGTIITGASSTVITAQEIERSPGQSLQDIAGARARRADDQPVRQRERGKVGRRHARLWSRRHLQHADSGQRTAAQRHRHGGRRLQRHPEEQHRADRDHPWQFGRGALWRRRGRRRHQHRHQECGRPAAVGAGTGGLRLVQLPGRQSLREYWIVGGQFAASVHANAIGSDGYRQNNKLRQENAVGDFRWTDGKDTTAYFNISADNQHLGLPGGRLRDADDERTRDQPPRRDDAVRLRRQEGHQRHARRHPSCCGRARS